MKKRILALVICLIMIATMLIACGDDYYDMAKDYIGNNKLKPAKPNVTLNMYIPCNGEIDAITLSSMQAEFNYVTETKYQTRVVFHMIPVAEYQQAVRDQASFAAQHIEDELDKTPASINDKYPKENDIKEPMPNITADQAKNLLEKVKFAYFIEENMVKRDFKKVRAVNEYMPCLNIGFEH